MRHMDFVEKWLFSVDQAERNSLAGNYPPHFTDVATFHVNFGLLPEAAAPLERTLARKRADQMREELREFEDACADNNPAKAVDALVDMVYFALGAAAQMGVTPHCWQECWDAVHAANMRKDKVPGLDTVKQGIVKPAGWESPDFKIRKALKHDGFEQ